MGGFQRSALCLAGPGRGIVCRYDRFCDRSAERWGFNALRKAYGIRICSAEEIGSFAEHTTASDCRTRRHQPV